MELSRRVWRIWFALALIATAHAQDLLPLEWRIAFAPEKIAKADQADLSDWDRVNLLLSWERQGYFDQDGKGVLACDFSIPPDDVDTTFLLSVGLQAAVHEVTIDGRTISGEIPAPTSTHAPPRVLVLPPGLLGAGQHRIKVTLSDLAYTGGISHNSCQLTRRENPDRKLASVRFEVASDNHVFVGRSPELAVRYAAPHPGTLRISVRSDFHTAIADYSIPVDAGVATLPLKLGSEASLPGFYECMALLDDAGDHKGTAEWFAVSPESLATGAPPVSGFRAFWTETLTELAAVKPDFQVRRVPEWSSPSRDGYDVQMTSLGHVPIRAFFFVPRSPGRHAAIMHVPGYSQRYNPRAFLGTTDNVAELAVCVRGHEVGSPGRFDPPNGPGIWGDHIYDAKTYSYRGIYMDCVRAVEFLRSRSDIDPSRIGVMGGSQGGGLTLATSGLCGDQIAACAYWDPWPCDMREHVRIRTVINKELRTFQKYYQGAYSVDQFQQVLDLMDTRNFASWITCPVSYSTALFDDDCPPRLGFAAYNLIRTPKKYVVFPEGSHVEGSGFQANARAFLKQQLGY